MSSYPAAVWTPPTRADGVDQVTAADYNTPAGEIAAIEGELGTNPRGSFATVKARLDRTDTIGASMYRASTANADTASGFRTMVGFDTVLRSDTGFTCTPASGTIAVPSDGYYLVEGHARMSATYSGGVVATAVNDGTNDIARGPGFSGGIEDVSWTTTTPWITAGTALRLRIFTATSASLVGNTAGTLYYMRVVRL